MWPDEPGSASRRFFYSAVFWLIVPILMGFTLSILLFAPPFQDLIPRVWQPYLNFGRLRPAHVNLAIFGWLSQAYAGAIYYILPRLTRTKLFSERLAHLNWWLWNLLLVGALLTLPAGLTQGREYAEMIWPLDLLLLLNWILLGANVWMTVRRRREPKIYVSLWNFMAGILIFLFVYAIGNKVWAPSGAYTGMNDNIINYFYVHNLFNSWFTTVGIGLALYLLPKLTEKPLYSHRLALWGLWSVWTGQHHQLWSPAPDWLEYLTIVFSILAAVPTIAFTWNFVKTMEGRWTKTADDVPLRFLVTGAFFWFLTCVQGVAQSFRGFSMFVHFTNWVVGHSHLAFVGDYSFWGFALVYLMFPVLVKRPMYSRRLMEWHYWLTTVGLSIFMVTLWMAGLIQAQNWLTNSVPFIETMRSLQPYMGIRFVGGGMMVAGQFVFAYNFLRTALARQTKTVAAPMPAGAGGGGE
jgi:cbb3-type cytochrome c oxidase subunit I